MASRRPSTRSVPPKAAFGPGLFLGAATLLVGQLVPREAWAQTAGTTEPPADPSATSPAPGEPAPEPAPLDDKEPHPTPPPPVIEESPKEQPVEDPMALKPSLKVGMGIRTGLAFVIPQGGESYARADDGVGNLFNIRPYFSGQITKAIGFTGNFETNQNGVNVLDAIVQVKVMDELQIWVGQHIPAMERNNFNGPFYNNGWNLPIVVQTLPFDIAGRDRGFTIWGLVAGGLIKYHASMVDLQVPQAGGIYGPAGLGNARFAGRVTVNFWDKENYYYTSGTYYGEQDTLALGAVFQGQKGVDGPAGQDLDNDLIAFTADLLFEKNLHESGVITLEGGYWNFSNTGAQYAPNQGNANFGTGAVGPLAPQSFLAKASWLTPNKIGWGKVQPLASLQMVDTPGTWTWALDAGVGYIIDGFNHRWFANYRHQGGGADLDMIQFGAQLQL